MRPLIAIDIGNSRLKWGLCTPSDEQAHWQKTGDLPTEEINAVNLKNIAANWPTDAQLVACNVAGEALKSVLDEHFTAPFGAIRWLHASAQQCGVHNGYQTPHKLGADRWAALIGARAYYPGKALVVCAGTATTIDELDRTGHFNGGFILPGLRMMQRALAQNTAQLPLRDGQFSDTPRNTADAIHSGGLLAQCATIEHLLKRTEGKATLILTGGAAPTIAAHLHCAHIQHPHLILDGLCYYAQSACE